MKINTYLVNVEVTTTFKGQIEIEAISEEEAERIAMEEYYFDYGYPELEEKDCPDIKVKGIECEGEIDEG
jgi:hypothetical protein